MPESNQMSRKRMRSASEILTKRKLQNQEDRSGRFVSQPGNAFPVHHSSSSLHGKIASKIIRTYPRATIKDLRLRRVFSPNSISSNWEFKTKGENPTKEQNKESVCNSQISNSGTVAKEGIKANAEAEGFIQTTPPDSELLSNGPISSVNEAAEHICGEINGSAVTKTSANLCRKSLIYPCSRAKIFKNPGSFNYKRLLPYFLLAEDDGTPPSSQFSKTEKTFDQNPPNINFSCNKETVETAEEPKEKVSTLMTESVDSLSGKTSPLKKVTVSSPTKKSVCSRRKLFKTPGSVNYRRMLPYLRDIQEDNPRVPKIVDHPAHEKSTEENAPSSILVSDNEETPETSTSNVAEESDTCSHHEKEPLPCERETLPSKESIVSVLPEQSDLDMEQETQVKHVIPDTEKNLRTLHNVLATEVPVSRPFVGSRSSSEVASSALNNIFVKNLVTEEIINTEKNLRTLHNVLATEVPVSRPFVGSRSSSEVASSALNNIFVKNLVTEEIINGSEKTDPEDSAEQQETDSSNLTTELLDPSIVLGTPCSISPSKGILKSSIRGCRGICSCLNCTSFRLNAERAFEFSRNQLQDTEVMVLDLVEEISHLKAMLEKYDSADHNESYNSQAGEAAKRAHEATELAKSRLHQMNNDLQVHCRIPNEQRARVKFSHHIHEKTRSPGSN